MEPSISPFILEKNKLVIFALIVLNLVIGVFFTFKYFEYREYLITQRAKESLRLIFTPILSPRAQEESQELDALRERARVDLMNK